MSSFPVCSSETKHLQSLVSDVVVAFPYGGQNYYILIGNRFSTQISEDELLRGLGGEKEDSAEEENGKLSYG